MKATSMKAVIVRERGEADVMSLETHEMPRLAPGEVLVEVEAAGVNYADLMQHRGTYPLTLDLPYTPGMEAVGRVVDTAPDVSRIRVGDRVAALSFAGGAYAEYLKTVESNVFAVPDAPDDAPDDALDAAPVLALLIQGLTAHALLRMSARLRPGENVLVHAAAGGVGLLAVRLAKRFGAGRVFGVTGDDAKARAVRDAGADAVFNRHDPAWTEAMREMLHETPHTGEAAIDIVLDPVGAAITPLNLDVLARGGRLVNYGWLSGETPHLTSGQTQAMLFANQSLTGFALDVFLRDDPGSARAAWSELMALLSSGELSPVTTTATGLRNAPDLHRALSEGTNTGKLCLRVR